jgi:cell wall-associated NlpC family hydrolase
MLFLRSVAVALALVATGCASGGITRGPRPFPAPGGSSKPGVTDSREPRSSLATVIVATALSLRGTPYRAGGSDLRGFDCSGFTRFVFAEHGVRLPRETERQFEFGIEVEPTDVEAGDLIFFSTEKRGASHVAIAIGNGEFVHAPSSAGTVRIEKLAASYWKTRLVGVRRIRPRV